MSLPNLLLALFLILYGLNATQLVAISPNLIGIVALIAGIAVAIVAIR